MLGYVKTTGNDDAKDRKRYHCAHCGVFITDSSALTSVNGLTRHSYVNPSGVRCNFMTFVNCENVLFHEDLYLEHSWFTGYGWRFLVCGACYLHLGWKYDAVAEGNGLDGFFGVLIDAVHAGSDDG